MGLIDCTLEEFAAHIKKERKEILCYGAGMMPLYAEPLLSQYGLLPCIRLFIDSNPEKERKFVSFRNYKVEIAMPDRLKMLSAEQYVLLIMAERYQEILNHLQQKIAENHWECYAYPLLNYNFFKGHVFGKLLFGKQNCIPKVIHYTWFGEGKKQNMWIESWKKQCPDYEIREWNETNYDIHKNRYIEQAYARKKWAYVSDYARLDILYRYGGVYLDADVELWQSLDELLATEAFVCFGEWPAPNSGAGIGCIKGHPIIKEMMETRENLDFIQSDGRDDPRTNSNYEMKTLMRHGFRMDFTCQTIDGMTLYPPDIIAPASITGKNAYVTKRSFGMHHCNNSWRNSSEDIDGKGISEQRKNGGVEVDKEFV